MSKREAFVLDDRGARISFSALGVDAHAFWGDPALRRVQEFLRQHPDQPFPLGLAAEIAGLEYTYFSQYFHRRVGITFVRWVNALRVSKALELLIDTDLPIAEIAVRTGYRDARTLQRNFKQLTGQQAKVLRQAFRGASRPRTRPPLPPGKAATSAGDTVDLRPAAAGENPSAYQAREPLGTPPAGDDGDR
ncbi:MAG TPA: AraC family transcriptional regulator [Thermoanaerobaculia bacterium]|nr:AraC family transcriptional regulator [Thermoanaerobaculia bacterium]